MALDRERQLQLGMDDRVPPASAPPVQRPDGPRPAGDSRQQTRGTTRAGRKPDSYYRVAVAAAVLQLDNRASLECNILAQLPAVGKLADERYPGKIWRRGLCLRDLVKEAVDETIDAADGPDMEKIRFVLTRAVSGDTLSSIAKELGIRRESLSRRLWSRTTGLVWERLKPRLLT